MEQTMHYFTERIEEIAEYLSDLDFFCKHWDLTETTNEPGNTHLYYSKIPIPYLELKEKGKDPQRIADQIQKELDAFNNMEDGDYHVELRTIYQNNEILVFISMIK